RRLSNQAEMFLNSIKRYEEQIAQYKSATETSNVTGAPRLQRRLESSRTKASEDEPQPKSESDYLQEALRPVEAGEQRIQGLFTKLECDSKGVAYFLIQSGDRVYKLRATSLGRVQLTAYIPVTGEVSCGARKNPENVVFTYRPTTDPKDLRAKID